MPDWAVLDFQIAPSNGITGFIATSAFRMAPARLLNRNIKPADVDEPGSRDYSEDSDAASPSDHDLEGTQDTSSEGEDPEREANAVEERSEDRSNNGQAELDIGNVSFGALKQAQDALSRKRKRSSATTAEHEEKLATLRSRLKQLKDGGANKVSLEGRRRKEWEPKPTSVTTTATTVSDDASDSDSAPSEEGAAQKSRSSKHAPTSRSSRYQITRKRTVVDVPKRVSRDPRFDAIQQRSAHPGNSEKAYSFLRDYQKTEIGELKSAIKQTKNEDEKATLKRKVISMENRIKSHEAKDRQQEIVRQHRKEEKDMVEQGKKPFFLKKKEVKERALVEKFKGMKGKDREKLIEKRKRKEGQREKKRMPEMRRVELLRTQPPTVTQLPFPDVSEVANVDADQ
ncbi:rRNA biogenesis protein rrp36 [Vermiconidia calcicola]|uniref:rRNA biogenesis protein rrp36 n=1 Tax=Vermiconidia calcicola TaxID=1690605 RepID=A0ACC3N3W8_9PEZI|nr:rRNA biogenesis protein rrp36 [Vermiconidia calcicola]